MNRYLARGLLAFGALVPLAPGVVGVAQGWDGIDATGHERLLGATLQAQGLSSRRNESCVLIG